VPLDRGVARRANGRGLHQEAGDGVRLGAPGQRDAGVTDVMETDATRRADVWGGGRDTERQRETERDRERKKYVIYLIWTMTGYINV